MGNSGFFPPSVLWALYTGPGPHHHGKLWASVTWALGTVSVYSGFRDTGHLLFFPEFYDILLNQFNSNNFFKTVKWP